MKGEISKGVFLTQSTAEGLRVTLKSVQELSVYLLKECRFKYVLTVKMNQDPLECFFGIVRQAGVQNEHPTFPPFLLLYHMLSLYSLLKPPQFSNCIATGSKQTSIVTLEDSGVDQGTWVWEQPWEQAKVPSVAGLEQMSKGKKVRVRKRVAPHTC